LLAIVDLAHEGPLAKHTARKPDLHELAPVSASAEMYIPVANSLVCRPKLDLNVYCVQKRQANVTSTTQGFVGDVDDGINRKALAGLIVATCESTSIKNAIRT